MGIKSKLQQLRINQNLTQKQVADHLGLTGPQLVSNWERGICSVPRRFRSEVARLYNIPEGDVEAISVVERFAVKYDATTLRAVALALHQEIFA